MSKPKADGKHSGLVPAVAYVRRSSKSESQEESIPEQIKAVTAFAAEKGYRILDWYQDDAISGDDTDKREAFLRMTARGREVGDFEAILCWDRKRFGRFDSIEYGYHVHPLRKAGVVLVTVTEGVIDWNDPMMRVYSAFTQEGANKDLVDHSANVARNQRGAMAAGSWVGSPAYGYRLVGPKKDKRLLLGEEAHVKTVQRIFEEFVHGDPQTGTPRSMNDIAGRLNTDGIPSPRGRIGGWHPDTVKGILRNPAYAGDFAAGRHSYGKYNTIGKNGLVRGSGRAQRARKPREQWFIRPDHHEAIIDRPTWEKAQSILDQGKTGRSPYKPDENPYAFSGKLRCGLCGGPMQGKTNGGALYYECSRRAHDLKRIPKEVKRDPAKLSQWLKEKAEPLCEGTTVEEHDVLLSLADFLDGYLGPEGEAMGAHANFGWFTPDDADKLPEAFYKVKALFTGPSVPKRDRKRLEARKKELEAKINKGRANLVFLDPENIPAAQVSIREHEAEFAEVERELRETKPPSEPDLNETVLRVLDNLWQLAYCCRALVRKDQEDRNPNGWKTVGTLEKKASGAVRRLIAQTTYLTCHTSKTGAGVRRRHKFEGGEIVVSVSGVSGRVNPHTRFKRPQCCR